MGTQAAVVNAIKARGTVLAFLPPCTCNVHMSVLTLRGMLQHLLLHRPRGAACESCINGVCTGHGSTGLTP